MQEIQEQAAQTYQKNLDFFSLHHQAIYNKLQNLQNTHYDLEYLHGYFDVKELASANYLYADHSIKISQQLTKLVNYKKNSYCFDGFPLYYGIEKHPETFDDKTKGLEGVYPLMSYYIDNTQRDDTMKIIEKFIFVGVGLGLHIPLIHQKIAAKEYLIIEDDLELFHLSLFCTPFYEFSSDIKLIFSIAEDENSFVDTMSIFLEDSFFLNRYLKYSYFPAHSDTKIKLIQNALASQDFISFPYKTLLTKYLRPLEYINQNNSIINLSSHFEHSSFSDKPLLVLGAGPSLQKNLEWLQENHKRFVIMAVSSTLRTLHMHNIAPDIVTHMDGFDAVLKVYEGFDAPTFLKDSVMLFGSFVPTKVREIFANNRCFFTEEDTYYFDGFNSHVGPCIGSTSILYALMLDTKNIYTLGTDFAVDKETGRTHSETHITKQQLDISKKDALNDTISFRQNLFAIHGNFTTKVYTNSLFHVSIQALHNRIPLIKREYQKLYNLNDGAKIHQAIPQKIVQLNMDSFEILDKKVLHEKIVQTFKQKSVTSLSQEGINSLHKRVSITDEIHIFIEKYHSGVKCNSSDKYLFELLGLASNILKLQGREAHNIVKVYYMFFKYTLPIIMDFFNTKGLKNEKRHIKKIDAMMIQEIENINNIYQERLEKFFEII